MELEQKVDIAMPGPYYQIHFCEIRRRLRDNIYNVQLEWTSEVVNC
jgi:hypothetical protein